MIDAECHYREYVFGRCEGIFLMDGNELRRSNKYRTRSCASGGRNEGRMSQEMRIRCCLQLASRARTIAWCFASILRSFFSSSSLSWREENRKEAKA